MKDLRFINTLSEKENSQKKKDFSHVIVAKHRF